MSEQVNETPEQEPDPIQVQFKIGLSPFGNGVEFVMRDENDNSVGVNLTPDNAAKIAFRLQTFAALVVQNAVMAEAMERMEAAEQARKLTQGVNTSGIELRHPLRG